MFRSVVTPAIVIRRERLGEYHKALMLLTADQGLLSAVAYGAWRMKSRLRMASEPFTHGLVRLYHNPVKGSYKVTEIEVKEGFEGIRAELDRITAASLWAEIALRSLAAGETSAGLYQLFLGCLRLLDSDGPDTAPAAMVNAQFLWRFLDLAGYRPDPSACERCGKTFADGEGCRWVGAASAVRCQSCAPADAPALGAGARRYLLATQGMALERAAAVQLDAASLSSLTSTLTAVIRDVLEGDLRTLRPAAL